MLLICIRLWLSFFPSLLLFSFVWWFVIVITTDIVYSWSLWLVLFKSKFHWSIFYDLRFSSFDDLYLLNRVKTNYLRFMWVLWLNLNGGFLLLFVVVYCFRLFDSFSFILCLLLAYVINFTKLGLVLMGLIINCLTVD